MAQVICSLCQHEQNVQQVCENCGVCMGEYFCSKCKFFDDEVCPSFMPLLIMGMVCDSSCMVYVGLWLDLLLKWLFNSCRLRSYNTTAISVEFAEQEDKKITFIVIVVAAAIQLPCRRDTRVLKSRCTKTVLFAWRCVSLHPLSPRMYSLTMADVKQILLVAVLCGFVAELDWKVTALK